MAGVRISVADPALVLLVGPSGAGKSTFAAAQFPTGSVLSSDSLREVIAGNADDQSASAEAFAVLALLVEGRLRRRLLTVIDATSLRADSRRRWLRLARRHGLPAVAICFDYPLDVYLELNRRRPGRQVEEAVVRNQAARMAAAMAALPEEGWDEVFVLHSADEAEQARVVVEPRAARS
jgi:predicted kinase